MVPNSLEKFVIVPLLLWLVVPIPVFIGSLILFRRVGGLPLLLVLIGSIGYLLWHGIDTFLDVLFPLVPYHHDSAFIQAVWPTCTAHWAFPVAMSVFQALSLCFPVGFVWFALRAARRT
jgi:hypothetical protein